MTVWTPALVEERLAEAAFVLKRLPGPRRQGYFSTWPAIVQSFADRVGQEPKPMRVLPSPQAISRMEETLGQGGYSAVRHHGGWCASVVTPGEIALGDAVAPVAAQ